MKFINLLHDIETNPGPKKKRSNLPLSSVKIFHASHNQGNARYGETAGYQCTCISLVSLVTLKNYMNFTYDVLDDTLLLGDRLYKKNIDDGYIALGNVLFEELNKTFTIQSKTYSFSLLNKFAVRYDEIDKIEKYVSYVTLNTAVLESLKLSPNVLVMVGQFAFSLFSHCDRFFVFDPHPTKLSADHDSTANGKSVLFEFENTTDVVTFIRRYIIKHSNEGRPITQLQPIRLHDTSTNNNNPELGNKNIEPAVENQQAQYNCATTQTHSNQPNTNTVPNDIRPSYSSVLKGNTISSGIRSAHSNTLVGDKAANLTQHNVTPSDTRPAHTNPTQSNKTPRNTRPTHTNLRQHNKTPSNTRPTHTNPTQSNKTPSNTRPTHTNPTQSSIMPNNNSLESANKNIGPQIDIQQPQHGSTFHKKTIEEKMLENMNAYYVDQLKKSRKHRNQTVGTDKTHLSEHRKQYKKDHMRKQRLNYSSSKISKIQLIDRLRKQKARKDEVKGQKLRSQVNAHRKTLRKDKVKGQKLRSYHNAITKTLRQHEETKQKLNLIEKKSKRQARTDPTNLLKENN